MWVYGIFLFLLFAVMSLGRLRTDPLVGMGQIEGKSLNAGLNPKRNILLCFAFSLLFCFSAFRLNVGWDYSAYYDTIHYNLATNIVGRGEYATILLIELSRSTGWENLFFAVNAFICVYCIYRTIVAYSPDPWVSLLFFVCFPLFFLNSLSVIRFFSALALTFYACKYIKQQKPLKYAVFIIMASLFHKSALIAGVFYFARYIKVGTFKLLMLFFLLPFIGRWVNRFIVTHLPGYAMYTETTDIQEGTKAIVFFLLITALTLLVRKKITQDDEMAMIYSNIFFLGIAIYLMFYDQGTMGHRLSLFGTIYGLLLVPKLFTLFTRKLERAFLKLLFYVLLVVMFFYIIKSGAEAYIPYRTIFGR